MNDRGLKSKIWRPILAALLLIFMIVIIAYVYTSYLDHFLESETQTTLKELSQQSANTIQNRLLFTDGFKHKEIQFNDKIVFFKERNKLGWRYQSFFRVKPADQGLSANGL